jgi:hypothetical protein
MRVATLLSGVCGVYASLIVGAASAATIVVTFPELQNPPVLGVAGPFPQLPLNVGTVDFTIAPNERVGSARISGFWGSVDEPASTAGVDLFVDGIVVARCVKPASDCWADASTQRPWSYTFSNEDLAKLADGTATLTAVQTSEFTVRLGVTTLVLETVPADRVPTLSAAALLLLAAGLALVGGLAARRHSG